MVFACGADIIYKFTGVLRAFAFLQHLSHFLPAFGLERTGFPFVFAQQWHFDSLAGSFLALAQKGGFLSVRIIASFKVLCSKFSRLK